MKNIRLLIFLFMSCLILLPGLLSAGSPDEMQVSPPDSPTTEEQQALSGETDDEYDDLSDYYDPYEFEDDYYSDEVSPVISDPLEPVNRAFFVINDKLYFWVLKPVAKGYKAITPTPVRKGIKNFFSNITFPVRFVNCLLQGKLGGAGYEFERFFINSTLGLGGFIDMADREFGVKPYDEDFGQTLGLYGIGHGFYIYWPIFGPSSARDTFGMVGDYFLEPTYYEDIKFIEKVAIKGYKTVNSTSLTLGDYELLKNLALDPYVAFRDAYIQYRQNEIKE